MLASHGHSDPAPYALDLLALDPDGVHRLFADLGFPHYRDQLQDHGISGDVLIHLDHAALKDVGVHSVGQRLAILKAVYDLKVAHDIPIEDGHYVPPSEDLDGAGPLPAYQILGLLSERDERIHRLESEVHSLHSALINLREDSLSVARGGGGGAGPSSKPRPSVRSPTGLGFVHPLSNSSTLSRSSSTPSRPRNPPPVAPLGSSSLALPQHAAGLPDSPHSPVVDSPRTMGDYQQQQQQQQHGQQYQAVNGHAHHDGSTATASASAPHLQPAEISISGVATPTTPTAPMLIHPDSAHHGGGGGGGGGGTPNSHLHPASSSSRPDHPSPTTATTATTSSSLSPSASTSRTREGSSSTSTSAAADNPYRSFRVTVEDPCYKVLPAALKKYKINDDWRLYALFICYGNTERCLAYDEKPLLLFQKLKESNDNPVFMLRHIKDIKSPIAVATAKHAARRDKRPAGIGGGVERSLMGVNRDGSAAPASASATTTPANGLQGNARPTRLHHPPVLLPVGKDKDKDKGDEAGEGEGGADKKDEGGASAAAAAATAGKKAQGYCIAIYPYLAEREDEFDVAVGDTFVILSKTKGWWVVHRDQASPSSSSTATSTSAAQLSSSTSSNADQYSAAPRKSAWVPAGCLLETSVPPLSLFGVAAAAASEGGAGSPSAAKTPTSATSTFPSSSTASNSTAAPAAAAAAGVPAHEGNAALVPIPPALVVSVSTPGVALMDYVPRGAGELEVRKGATLRILKRYNHWSYAVKDDGGRGWLPSWFCGRVAKADAAAAAAAGGAAGAGAGAGTTPTTPVAPESGHAPPSNGAASSSSAPAASGSAAAGGTASPRPATAPGGAPKPPLSVNVPPLLPGASGGARSAGAAMMLEPSAEAPSAGAGGSGGGAAAGGTGATASKEGQD
ncbi:hypothetical protein JCM9279_003303 [Rhodotorula babjevae]